MKKIAELYQKYKEIILYLFYGGCTTLVNIASYFVFARVFDINEYVSNGFAWVLSVLFAFITNKLFVFNSKTKNKKEVTREVVSFFAFRLLSLGFDMGAMYVMIQMLNMNDMIAKIIANVVVVILNYVFSKLFIFKGEKK